MDAALPNEVTWHAASGVLALGWPGGLRARLTATRLRAACRCAGCERQRRDGLPPAAPEGTALAEIRPIGVMGVQLVFSDGHDRGIYPWPYLHQLAQEACV